MRKARSVAWFSTAGFHQRSKWKTWLAAVRFRPVPPALSDRMKIRRRRRRRRGLEPLDHAVALLLGRRRRGGTAPRGRTSPGGGCGGSPPISANWVKTRARSPASSASSSISVSRASLPERPGIAELSWRNCAGWLQTCLSFASVARTSPLRWMPSDDSSLLGVSCRRRPRRATPAPWSGCRRPSSPASRAGRR